MNFFFRCEIASVSGCDAFIDSGKVHLLQRKVLFNRFFDQLRAISSLLLRQGIQLLNLHAPGAETYADAGLRFRHSAIVLQCKTEKYKSNLETSF